LVARKGGGKNLARRRKGVENKMGTIRRGQDASGTICVQGGEAPGKASWAGCPCHGRGTDALGTAGKMPAVRLPGRKRLTGGWWGG